MDSWELQFRRFRHPNKIRPRPSHSSGDQNPAKKGKIQRLKLISQSHDLRCRPPAGGRKEAPQELIRSETKRENEQHTQVEKEPTRDNNTNHYKTKSGRRIRELQTRLKSRSSCISFTGRCSSVACSLTKRYSGGKNNQAACTRAESKDSKPEPE
jgi:hypothetical protein